MSNNIKVIFQKFRTLVKEEVTLYQKKVNVFIGINSSGKTNALEGIAIFNNITYKDIHKIPFSTKVATWNENSLEKSEYKQIIKNKNLETEIFFEQEFDEKDKNELNKIINSLTSLGFKVKNNDFPKKRHWSRSENNRQNLINYDEFIESSENKENLLKIDSNFDITKISIDSIKFHFEKELKEQKTIEKESIFSNVAETFGDLIKLYSIDAEISYIQNASSEDSTKFYYDLNIINSSSQDYEFLNIIYFLFGKDQIDDIKQYLAFASSRNKNEEVEKDNLKKFLEGKAKSKIDLITEKFQSINFKPSVNIKGSTLIIEVWKLDDKRYFFNSNDPEYASSGYKALFRILLIIESLLQSSAKVKIFVGDEVDKNLFFNLQVELKKYLDNIVKKFDNFFIIISTHSLPMLDQEAQHILITKRGEDGATKFQTYNKFLSRDPHTGKFIYSSRNFNKDDLSYFDWENNAQKIMENEIGAGIYLKDISEEYLSLVEQNKQLGIRVEELEKIFKKNISENKRKKNKSK